MQALVFAAVVALQPAHGERFNPLAARRHAVELIEQGQSRQLTTEALDSLLGHAVELLTQRDHAGLGAELAAAWRDHYRLLTLGAVGDMGDHAPLSGWLAETYDRIEAVLGPEVCDMTHLSDLDVLNYTTPVVFSPHAGEVWCQEHLTAFPEASCEPEYRRHFAGTRWQRQDDDGATARLHFGLAPVATYWLVFGACEAALWGTDGTLGCGAVSEVAEVAVARYVAPRASVSLWERFNP